MYHKALAFGEAADAQRGVGAGDQKRPREAAAGDRRAAGLLQRLRAETRHVGRRLRRRLGELIDPLLQKLLIGAQIRQFVGARRRKTRQQRDRRGEPADRRKGANSRHSGHRDPPIN